MSYLGANQLDHFHSGAELCFSYCSEYPVSSSLCLTSSSQMLSPRSTCCSCHSESTHFYLLIKVESQAVRFNYPKLSYPAELAGSGKPFKEARYLIRLSCHCFEMISFRYSDITFIEAIHWVC